MDKAQFWQIIEQSQNKSNNCEEQAAKLQKLLSKLSAEEIGEFSRIFDEFSRLAYSWDLWGAAYIINGGASDDGFQYFRWWLIAQGQQYFEAAIENPERAGDKAAFEEAECEDIPYCIADAYQHKTGQNFPRTYPESIPQPTGQPWEDDDLDTRFPTLCEKFG